MQFSRRTFLLTLLLIVVVMSTTTPVNSAALAVSATELNELPEAEVLHHWIEQMKQNKRGPFKRLRWFCNDGSILPPKAYACSEHAGGVQHGEWTDRVKLLRQHNFLIGNLLADQWRETFYQQSWRDHLKQIILERFIREMDGDWIFRQTPYYRGAVQAEDENWHGRSLLLGLLQQDKLREEHFLLLREAVRFLPHGQGSPVLTEMRQLSQTLAEQDPDFSPFRIKLHSKPEAEDALDIHIYAETASTELQDDYLQLAGLVKEVTSPQSNVYQEAIRLQISGNPHLIRALNGELTDSGQIEAVVRFARISQLLIQIRSDLDCSIDENIQLEWLDLSLRLEQELYLAANEMLGYLPDASRRQRLAWIEIGIDALYGTGLLSTRERDSLHDSLRQLYNPPASTTAYQREIEHLARMTHWAENRYRYHFDSAISHLAKLDNGFQNYYQERLRVSPLLPISLMIDSLQIDSRQLRGVSSSLFDKEYSGLQPLNPGLARGRLQIVDVPNQHKFSAEGIYLLPETVENLPPVAGILTRGAGNALSHVQLLARNLGIPNIAISTSTEAVLARHQGAIIVVSVSPGGVIKIEADSEQWQEVFRQKQQQPNFLIETDLDKLELQKTGIINLDHLQANDSGRIAGPKGSNLGELRQHYKELVPDALVIPFGHFARFLEQTTAPDGQTLFNWMRKSYQQLAENPDGEAQTVFLSKLRELIVSAQFSDEFLHELHTALRNNFGPDGSYGVFVRSDTNVEDLPNFTGAGLNRTVPNVVGINNIVQAIKTVWASPFTDRAYSWRQAHMPTPEHLYASVLIMLSVPADKSGVMATSNPVTGDSRFLQVAVNEGVGGAVSGQRAEEILVNRETGKVRLLAQSSFDQKRILLPQGGVQKVPSMAPEYLLNEAEIETLQKMADQLPKHFPRLRNPDGTIKPADIEFGFLGGRFILFQIRPLVESKRVRKDLILQRLDAGLSDAAVTVDLWQIPSEVQP